MTQDQVCFGMLDQIPIRQTRSSVVRDTDSISVYLKTEGSNILHLYTQFDAKVGILDQRFSKIFGIIQGDGNIEMQAYIVPEISVKITYTSSREVNKSSMQSRKSTLTLSVIFYGPMEIFEPLGDFLNQCSVYLQYPLRSDRDVIYRNPQSLCGRDSDPLRTFQVQAKSSASGIETVVQEEDPSAVLESNDDLPETEPPAVVRTALQSHQKRALSFMLRRERKSTTFDSDAKHLHSVTDEATKGSPEEVRGGILADCMGLGKTLSVLSLLAFDYVRSDRVAYRYMPTLIVVPPSLLRTWEEEFEKHIFSRTLQYLKYHGSKRFMSAETLLTCDIVLTSYDIVALEWRNLHNESKLLFSTTWRRIILDEAHEIRVSSTTKARAACDLSGQIRWAVSGTPIQNRWEDLASLLKFLRVYSDDNIRTLKTFLSRGEEETPVRDLLGKICLRRPKSALDLPPRLNQIRKVVFDEDEAAYYDSINSQVINELKVTEVSRTMTYPAMLTKINMLRQICNLGTSYQRKKRIPSEEAPEFPNNMLYDGLALCSKCEKHLSYEDRDDAEWPSDVGGYKPRYPKISRCGQIVCASCLGPSIGKTYLLNLNCQHQPSCEFTTMISASMPASPITSLPCYLPSKIRALKGDILALPTIDKSIIFSSWRTTLDLVRLTLDEIGFSHTRVDGTMSPKQRQQAFDSFSKDPNIRTILISLGCGSAGLTLTAANHVFLMEPQWNPSLEDQALDRVYRIGQKKKVTTTRYIVENTIEESIRHQQLKKRDLAEQAFSPAQRTDDWIVRMQSLLSGGA